MSVFGFLAEILLAELFIYCLHRVKNLSSNKEVLFGMVLRLYSGYVVFFTSPMRNRTCVVKHNIHGHKTYFCLNCEGSWTKLDTVWQSRKYYVNVMWNLLNTDTDTCIFLLKHTAQYPPLSLTAESSSLSPQLYTTHWYSQLFFT